MEEAPLGECMQLVGTLALVSWSWQPTSHPQTGRVAGSDLLQVKGWAEAGQGASSLFVSTSAINMCTVVMQLCVGFTCDSRTLIYQSADTADNNTG